MTDKQVVEYLRTRGRTAPPSDLVRSVMAAVDTAPAPSSRFSSYLPAIVVAGAIAVIAVVGLLIGPGRDVGPPPMATDTPSASASSMTLEELEAAVTAATERLAASAGVQGTRTYTIEGYLASATWFDWRPGGDEVVITRTDIDVSAPWWTDPNGEPLSVGERIDTDIWVILDATAYASREESWLVLSPADAPRVLDWGTGMLSGAIPPVGGVERSSDAVITRHVLGSAGEVWRVEIAEDDRAGIIEWRIAPDGRLSSYVVEGTDIAFDPAFDLSNTVTRVAIEFTPVEAPDPIAVPNPDGVPDPALLGLPADFPLGGADDEAVINYRAYVEDALDALEAYHWNAENVDWATARAAALDGLPDDPAADQAHARIQRAIETFDQFHTVLVRPQDVPPAGQGGGGLGPLGLPSADRIGTVGLLALPATGDDLEALQEYLRLARTAMAAVEASEPACGWVVDLRDYAGGAWGPTMMVVGGLLGEGSAVRFSSTTGEWGIAVGADGVLSIDVSGEPAAVDSPYISFGADADDEFATMVQEEPPYVPSVTDPPMAVLVGSGTAWGGEQTLVAFLGRPETRVFGMPTQGTPIVAPNLPMADGARLRIPIWVPVDREGTRHTTNIVPDEIVGDTRGRGADAVLDAAVEWLESQAGCS